jgi:galactokinase
MSSRFADALERAGCPTALVVSRAALFEAAAGRLAASREAVFDGAWFVPGRLELLGKHTDYAGGRSIVTAVPRGIAVVMTIRPGNVVRVLDARYGGEVAVEADEHERVFAGWHRYVAVVARRLARNFPGALLGADIAIASDLPRAAGVSSSSALVVGVVKALAARAQLGQRAEWRSSIRTPADLAGYCGAIENGSAFDLLAGGGGVGTEGGSQDHTAILACQANHVSGFRYAPTRRLGDVPLPDSWRLVVMTSGIHAGKASEVRERYNRASRSLRAIVDVWTRRTGRRDATLAAMLASESGAAGEVRAALLTCGEVHGFTSEDLIGRLDHFVAEDARVPIALEACREANADRLGELVAQSQRDAAESLGNQIPETQALARAAVDAGARAATSFGAGFGGAVWALVVGDDEQGGGIARRWMQQYRAACPHVPPVEWFIATPGPPALELPLRA